MLDLSETEARPTQRSSWALTGLAVVSVCAFMALYVTVGADCYWVVAMGRHVAAHGVPDGIPFAEAPTEGWPNALVLAQLALAGVHEGGQAALPLAQILVDAVALCLLAVGARRAGASDRATAIVIVLVGIGALASLAVVRLQIFSPVPFALLLLLLRSEDRAPSRWIWLLPLLVAVWSNLHGAVLLGVAVAGTYLVLGRLLVRPLETVLVGLATLAALLVTPVGLRTVPYYLGVFENEAAKRATGLWARPSISNPFDVLMVLAAVVLLAAICWRPPRLWECIALAGLTVGTLMASRHGVWLLMTAAAPAAAALSRAPRGTAGSAGGWKPVLVTVAATVGLSAMLILPRGDALLAADPALAREVADQVGDRVVLAPEPLAESLALEGVTVWAADPIDAFAPEDQRAFVDFLDGGDEALRAVNASDAVVVENDSDAADLMATQSGFDSRPLNDGWTLYLRQ
jgi:hypothetical protein